MTNNSAVEILTVARQLIEAGWVQGVLTTTDPHTKRFNGFCLLGALVAAKARSGVAWSPAYDYVKQVLPVNTNVVTFNDADNRTQEEILEIIDQAIALAKEAA